MTVSQLEDLEAAFAVAQQNQVDALAVSSVNMFALLDQVAEQTRRRRLPAMCDFEPFDPSGGLMSYTPDALALFRGAGRFVDKILKGTSPADLPVELPTTFRFVINKTTADAIGLTIPPTVLAQATEVLQ